MLGNRPATDVASTCAYGHLSHLSERVVTECPTCYDLSVASDVYKSTYNVRPRWMSERDLLAWLRSQPIGA